MTFSADGELAVLGDGQGNVRIWDLTKGQVVGKDFKAHAEAIHDLLLTPDKKKLITADAAGEIKIWDVEKRLAIKTLPAQPSSVVAMASSGDGARFRHGARQERGAALGHGHRQRAAQVGRQDAELSQQAVHPQPGIHQRQQANPNRQRRLKRSTSSRVRNRQPALSPPRSDSRSQELLGRVTLTNVLCKLVTMLIMPSMRPARLSVSASSVNVMIPE